MKVKWVVGTVALGATLPVWGMVQGRANEPDTLYYFFSPEAQTAQAGAKTLVDFAKAAHEKLRIRPVLLVEHWEGLRKVTPESVLWKTVQELGRLREPAGVEIPLYDVEGLALAKTWKITRLPAYVLVIRGRAHAIYGPNADLGSLLGCER
jgi:hypothetical protein